MSYHVAAACGSCMYTSHELVHVALAGGFPQSSAVAFAASLALVGVGLVLYSCGGTVYPATSSEDCYRVIRSGPSPPPPPPPLA